MTRTCVVLVCDVCGDGWTDLDAEPHFVSRSEATDYATAAGWVVTAARAVCRQCTRIEVCALGGHRWAQWTPAGPFPSANGGVWHGRVRHCQACTAAEWDPPPARSRSAHGRQAG